MDKSELYNFIENKCKIKNIKEILLCFWRSYDHSLTVRYVNMSQDLTFSGFNIKNINWKQINAKLKEMGFPGYICVKKSGTNNKSELESATITLINKQPPP